MTPAGTSARTSPGERRCWRRCVFTRPIKTCDFSQRIIFIHPPSCLFFHVKRLCFIPRRPGSVRSACLSWTPSCNGSPPSAAASAFGSDQDYQLDLISELDLANATYGITQVAGLHNNSKAFLFRGNARTHSRTLLKFTHTRAHATLCFH